MSPRFPYHISVAAMARSFEKMVNHDVKPPLPPPPKPTVVVPSVSSSSTTSSVSTASSTTLSSPSSIHHHNDDHFAALLFTLWMHINVQLAVLVLVRSSSYFSFSLSPPLAHSSTTRGGVSQLCLLDDIPCLNDLVDRHTQPPVASLWHEHEQAGYAKRIQMGPSRRRIRKPQQEPRMMQETICGQVVADNDDVEEEEEATMTKLAQDVLSYLNQCSSSYEASSELLALTPRLQGYAAAV
ncbi:hypothetical protein O0I10_004343 [Lichtheimia ornata]|uniref:Uncharacterized protein n=1 Tax=Lichtheimia ornata TaxID=688661 RepID=A0AAD7XZ45_9FUNG|nr:uncharacterized protein O0I10_004343 [Lichtheimia ornata]KAJ8659750.1 hypothetical protein O0I10_004343 [Lichtheimia ornata]